MNRSITLVALLSLLVAPLARAQDAGVESEDEALLASAEPAAARRVRDAEGTSEGSAGSSVGATAELTDATRPAPGSAPPARPARVPAPLPSPRAARALR